MRSDSARARDGSQRSVRRPDSENQSMGLSNRAPDALQNIVIASKALRATILLGSQPSSSTESAISAIMSRSAPAATAQLAST
jgi:hypothetical protein